MYGTDKCSINVSYYHHMCEVKVTALFFNMQGIYKLTSF